MNRFFLHAFLLALSWSCSQSTSYDLVICNGKIIDGLGTNSFIGTVGIRADTIAYIGSVPIESTETREYIDATGMIVAPGFIDPHTHAGRDLDDALMSANLNYLKQGVTTVFVGNDGRSALKISDQLERWEKQGIGTNAASFVGHGSIRAAVMGMKNLPPTQREIHEMKRLIADAMESGALGLSTGLYYAPGSYASTKEVIELTKVASDYGGHYDTHIRDESSYNIGLIGAISEAIEIAKGANIHGHIAHIKCLGVDVWGQSKQVVQIIEEARAEKINITADQYPYDASGTSIKSALIPRWFLAEGKTTEEKFDDQDMVRRLEKDIRENIRKRGGAKRLLVTRASGLNKQFIGNNLAEVSQQLNMNEAQAAITLFKQGETVIASYNMKEEDITFFMSQPWVMTSSDGSNGHPRKYGSFSKKIKEYVQEKKILTIEQMIHQSSGLTAQTFNLTKRGILKKGNYADLIVFNVEEIRDLANFERPTAFSEGMQFVIVNGQIAIEQGLFTGVLGGRALKNNLNN
jgi:N-acyl-D-amino-acid deacylase